MGLLSRTDLKYDYNWRPIPKEDSRIAGVPNSTLFNRNEGFEVLWLINFFAQLHGLTSKECGFQLERLIKERLPFNLRNQTHVIEWLEQNTKELINRTQNLNFEI